MIEKTRYEMFALVAAVPGALRHLHPGLARQSLSPSIAQEPLRDARGPSSLRKRPCSHSRAQAMMRLTSGPYPVGELRTLVFGADPLTRLISLVNM